MPKKVTSKKEDSIPVNPLYQQLNNELQSLLKDPDLAGSYAVLSENVDFADLLSDKLLIVRIIRKGLPYSMFSVIQKYSPFSMNDWAEYLNLSGKSLLRYKQQNKSFKSIHSEKIIELAEVTRVGTGVFGDAEKFRLWLETPNYALGSYKPFELLRDSYGKEMIIAELIRIEHGILA